METNNIVDWDDVPEEIKELYDLGIFTEEEIAERLIYINDNVKVNYDKQVYSKPTPYYHEPVYATKGKITKREARVIFTHQGNMSEWRLEMLLDNGCYIQANDEWNKFIEDLLEQGDITKRQYNNWKDRFKYW